MMIKTRVFELSMEKHENLSGLAQAMGISVAHIYRVRGGKRGINQKFIIGAMRASPGYKLDDLFYLPLNVQIAAQSSRTPPAFKNGRIGNVGNNGNREKPTYAEIARRLGISRERVRQIANRQKLDKRAKATVSSKISEVAGHPSAMLTTREVAQLLNLHVNTVRRWSDRGILRAYRVGPRGDRRFNQQDITRFLSNKSRDSKRR
jgi:excisionase family DNA binding protein